MNALQYLVLGMATVAVIGTPYMLAKAIRRKQKYRIFEVPLLALALVYTAVDTAFPTLKATAPQAMDWAFITLVLLFVINFCINYRKFFKDQKVLPVERR